MFSWIIEILMSYFKFLIIAIKRIFTGELYVGIVSLIFGIIPLFIIYKILPIDKIYCNIRSPWHNPYELYCDKEYVLQELSEYRKNRCEVCKELEYDRDYILKIIKLGNSKEFNELSEELRDDHEVIAECLRNYDDLYPPKFNLSDKIKHDTLFFVNTVKTYPNFYGSASPKMKMNDSLINSTFDGFFKLIERNSFVGSSKQNLMYWRIERTIDQMLIYNPDYFDIENYKVFFKKFIALNQSYNEVAYHDANSFLKLFFSYLSEDIIEELLEHIEDRTSIADEYYFSELDPPFLALNKNEIATVKSLLLKSYSEHIALKLKVDAIIATKSYQTILVPTDLYDYNDPLDFWTNSYNSYSNPKIFMREDSTIIYQGFNQINGGFWCP